MNFFKSKKLKNKKRGKYEYYPIQVVSVRTYIGVWVYMNNIVVWVNVGQFIYVYNEKCYKKLQRFS